MKKNQESETHLRIETDLLRKAHRLAEQQHMSLAALIRQLLRRALDEASRRPIGLLVMLMLFVSTTVYAQDVTSQVPSNTLTQWTLTTRGVHNFPVPLMMPGPDAPDDSVLAFDYGVKGNPADYANIGVNWHDGCLEALDNNPYATPSPSLHCFHLGIGHTKVELGESLFGGAAALPLYISLGVDKPKIVVSVKGGVCVGNQYNCDPNQPNGSFSVPAVGSVVGQPACFDSTGKLGVCAQ